MRHDTRLVQRGLTVHQQHVAVAEVAVDLLGEGAGPLARRRCRRRRRRPHLIAVVAVARRTLRLDARGGGGGGPADGRGRREQSLGDRRALLRGEPVEVDDAAALVLDGVGSGVNLRAVFNQLAHQVHVVFGDVLRKRELLREHGRNADLGRSKVRIGHDHRAGGVIHALAHHVHAKEALLLLQLLPDPRTARLAALPGRVDQLVHAALEGEPRADRALRANLGGLRDRRRLSKELRQGQVRLDNRVEVRVLRVFEHHVSHPARRSQLARGHEHRLHEEPGGIGSVHDGILRALGQPVRGRRRGPDHRAEVVLSRPQPLEERASLDRGDEDLLTRLLRRVVHAHLLLLALLLVRAVGVGVAVRVGGV